MPTQTARQKNRAHGKGRNRTSKLHNYWHKKERPKPFHNWFFRVHLIKPEVDRKKKAHDIPIDANIESISWDDKLIQAANLTLATPDPDKPIKIREGHKIKVEAAKDRGDDFKELWTLRITQVSYSASGGEISLEAADELAWLRRSKDDFLYKKGDAKKSKHAKANGWRCDEIVRDVCKRYGLRIGRLSKGQHKIKNLHETNVSPLKVIQKAYELERDATGKRYVIQMRKGKLFVTRLRRTPELLILGGDTLETTLTQTLRGNFATELAIQSSLKRAKGKHKKINVVVKARDMIAKRYGKVHAQWTLDDPVSSETEARQRGRRRLAWITRPHQEVDVTVPGDPTLRRGAAVRVKLPHYIDSLLYVKSASHTMNGGDYSTDLVMSFHDFLYSNKKDRKTRDRICQKAKKHHRKQPHFCKEGKNWDPAPPSPRQRNRQSHHRPKAGAQ